MTPAMIALILTIWALPVLSETAGLTANITRFLSIFNGVYDNLPEEQSEFKDHDFVYLRGVPVTTPALPGRTVLFVECSYGDQVFDLELCELFEDSRGLLHLKLYNFTDVSKYRPGEYKLDNLQTLTPDDITDKCHFDVELKANGPDEFFGTWPTCRRFVDWKSTVYSVVFRCNSVMYVAPPASIEEFSPVPYSGFLRGDKFKIPGAPDDFVSPCQ